MFRRFTTGVAGFVLIHGCAVGPDYVEPEAELEETFVQATEGLYTADPIPATLWESFGDPDLEALIGRALAENTTIAQALATLNETRALSGLALYSWFPTVGIGIDATRNQPSSRDPFIPPGVSATDLYRAGFDMAWEIDLFGRLRNLNEGIRQRVEADTAALQAAQLSIVAEVAQSYFSLRGTQQRLLVQQRNLDNLVDNVRILEASLEAGRGTALDVARVKSLERTLAAQLPQTRALIARAEQRLGVLTAQGVEALRNQLAARRELPAVPDMVAVGTPEEWLRRRPDVQAAERRLAEATSNVGVEVSAYYPRLDLLGTFGWTGNGTGDLGSGEAERWTFGPAISWRILDFGRIRQNVLAAEARADRAFAVFEETLLLAIEEAENGLAGYRAASLTAEALAEAVAESQTASDLARLRFDNGVGDYLAVLDAERTQLDLEDQYAVAVTDRTTALAALYKALGGDFATPGGP
ncbi:MAG: efflux transporter outer membrane subunit [Gammaproteobacteria bacterium]|nr:efflux transporter outer membrane subunit [Gammaproteobacteria bacterium]